MLKLKYEKQEDIPKGAEAFYEEKEEGGNKVWQLKIEGAVDKAKLDEFRTTNVNLKKQLADLELRFEGVDAAEYTSLKTAVGGLKADEIPELLKKAQNVDKLVNDRTKTMVEDHNRAVTTLKTDRDKLQQRLEHVEITQSVITEAMKLGLRPGATADISWRARQTFKLDPKSGKVVAYEENGTTIRYGKDTDPLTISEWVEIQRKEAAHLFEDSKGGGSGGGDGGKGSGGGTDTGPNPFKEGPTFNMTEQMKLRKTDPARAKRLAMEAGKVLPA